jgi:hypothetical protein
MGLVPVPAPQVVPAAGAPLQVPLAPQCLSFVVGSMQPSAPHHTCEAVQMVTQVPWRQALPAPQAVPPVQFEAAPQKLGSLSGSMHFPPQANSPERQLVAQAPAAQTCPAAHTVPAVPPVQAPLAPQKARSVSGSTHFPLQAIWPAGQLVAQIPAAQTWPPPQAVPAGEQLAPAPQ